ncbi:expressed unknown protein [Seminavis robusta]|uniref:Uncharacterized protein n=1 Tax=Seminavis robusta TaxID=568900 RepID=A0A9N8DBW7_9STRA|nr:expressed unknown protein [Seminavis robusta]|eukprot:Sro27_g018380.1 n/a (310) ;mRNA; r:144261-145190
MATTIRRSNNNDGLNVGNGTGFRIPPVVIVIVLSLCWNIFKAQIKNWYASTGTATSRSSSSGNDDGITLTDLLASGQVIPSSSSLDVISSGGLLVQSNFVQDPDLLEQFRNPQLWESCVSKSQQNQCQWLDLGATPSSVWEEMAIRIWNSHPTILSKKRDSDSDTSDTKVELAGYEYWCNIIRPHNPLEWHVDKDEVEFELSEMTNLKTPYMGAVWYGYPHQMAPSGEGYLEVLSYDPYQIPDPTELADLPHHVERIRPHYNRLVFLNVSQWHRVTPITSGARYTLAVNVWTQRPREPPETTTSTATAT